MENHHEDRLEPEVEVIHEPEAYSSSSGYRGITRPPSSKKWILIPIILIGIVFLAMGLWMVLPTEFSLFKGSAESPEFKTLQAEVQKLRTESDLLKKEIQSLQEAQKALQEQVTALKDQLTVLAKKTETMGEKKPVPRAILYKSQKGDTLNSIAKKFHVHPEEIRRWNRLPLKSQPQPGQKLTIYSSIP